MLDTSQIYYKQIERYPVMSREEELEVARRAKAGDTKARDRLVTSNLRFVVSRALKFQGRGLDMNDLIAEGNVGLVRALERFDPDRGFKFISYAVWWIDQSLSRAIDREGTVHRPQNVVRNATILLDHYDGEESVPEPEQIAEELGWTVEAAEAAVQCHQRSASLDETIFDDGGRELRRLDNLTYEEEADPFDAFDDGMAEEVRTVLDGLDERLQGVLRKRFGLDGGEPMPLKEIGIPMGVSRERVRQLEERALGMLRGRSKHLRTYLTEA